MRLFQKMGYKGGGLGKHEQGTVPPIEAKLRPKNMGIGFNHYEEDEKSEIEDVEKSVPRPSQKEKRWSKKVSKKKVDDQELLAQKEERGCEVVQKILDMRGPQVRLLPNLENLNAEAKARESDVPMPELQHNIKLIVDIVELDMRSLDNKRETGVALHKEKEKLQKEAHDQKKQLQNMEVIMNVLDQIGDKSSSGSLSLHSLAKSFLDLQTRFAHEYTICNLSCIACSYASPLFITLFQGWNPLQNPTHGIELLKLWKTLLQGEDASNFSPYTQLLIKVVFPAVRISSWQPRDPEPMFRLFDSWESLLPPSVLQTILDTFVVPMISAAVDSWDPCTETIPIHYWIHPWLPLLGHKLENCYHTIRYKLACVLPAWHPSDMSAYHILSPWKTVFDPESWEQLMARYIFPKLLTVMNQLQINPANQNLDQFNWVRKWMPAIPTHHKLQLMDVFFDKWQEALYHWLCSNPNFEEVAKWYLGWKDLLPPELQANEHVRFSLNLGLDMMNKAVEGVEVAPPGLKEKFETRKKAQENEMQAEMMSLKEVIGVYAQQIDLPLMPKSGRMHDSHQIYGFGNISIIIDTLNQKVFAYTEDRCNP